jgi:Fe-S-cluster containining protein
MDVRCLKIPNQYYARPPFEDTWMSGPSPASLSSGEDLCLRCGLCCDGTLFGDVELQGSDDLAVLSQAGVVLRRKGKRQIFTQPCACLDGRSCRIYQNRPARCRTFDCQVLRRSFTRELNRSQALRLIARARKYTGEVERLLSKLGNRNHAEPLNRRYSSVIAEPVDLTADSSATWRLRGDLMRAAEKLAALIATEFLGDEPDRSIRR